jgi:hypothetical protein
LDGIIPRRDYIRLNSAPSYEELISLFSTTSSIYVAMYCLRALTVEKIPPIVELMGVDAISKLKGLIELNIVSLDLLVLKFTLLHLDDAESGKVDALILALLDILSHRLLLYDDAIPAFVGLIYESFTRHGMISRLFHRSLGLLEKSARLLDLKHPLNVQVRYMMVFCFWRLSFHRQAFAAFDVGYKYTKCLGTLFGETTKEKIQRLLVYLFSNLSKYGSGYINCLIRLQIKDRLDDLVLSKEDVELQEESLQLRLILNNALNHISTFDEYVLELESGHLETSPLHSSTIFWKNNASKLEYNDHRYLRMLLQFLASQDSREICVALEDIRCYLENRTKGKSILETLGLKKILARLLDSPDDQVRFQSLLCMHKLICSF